MKYKTSAYNLIIFLLFTGIFITNRESIKNLENSSLDLTADLRSSANSGRIHINNNWTETKTAGICTGDGTESSPYTLTNLIIDAGGIGHAILIENTTEYFKIENCTIFNSGEEFNDAGITLANVRNGRLINNTLYNNSQGMALWSSLNLIIARNRIFDNIVGIKLLYTNDSIFYLNTLINSISDMSDQWSSNQYNSKDIFSYTYNGSSYTNYLGNYWHWYSEPDNNGDGIIDVPYIVESYVKDNPDRKDFYPLFEPIGAYSNIEKVEVFIPSFNLIGLLGLVGMILILLTTTIRKLKLS